MMHHLFQELAAESGILGKKRILKKMYPFKKVFYYALNPYLTYGITANSVKGEGTLHLMMSPAPWDFLDALASRELTGNAALEGLREYQKILAPADFILLCRIINKDLRCGVSSKTVNAVWPGLIPSHDVQLAYPINWKRVIYPCYTEPKIDGLRATVKDGKFYSRKGLVLPGLEHLEKLLRHLPNYEWDGELDIPGLKFQTTSGLLRSGKGGNKVRFTIFACRNNPLYRQENHADLGMIQFIKYRVAHSKQDIMDHYTDALMAGYEGLMVKTPFTKYEGKRSYNWQKVKPQETHDLVVIGQYEGEGKYEGMLGGLIVDYNGRPNRVGTGFSDSQRRDFWAAPLVGQTVEVEFMEETDDGNLRHSRFKGVRWDK